ncbi:ABC transporter permease [Rheinheimera maricola]|uniref:Transport permease protein n=1 Tax=Rheinheimera maricola TaxID=2793282 RepID=A0ABS7X416_9GAMM|nr:ABC transporter permease [Rheinheimera maricola]MBZ9610301.1 ABC transporter permease [Rheinheimera maricola]
MTIQLNRSSWQVTLDVWRAMFLREIVSRISADRFGWVWLILEPILHIVLFVAIRMLMGRVKFIPGAEFVPWFVIGMMGFFLFRQGITRSMGAINGNKALFAYRQVQPLDAVLVRCFIEGILKTLVLLIIIAGATLLEYHIIPHNMLGAMAMWAFIWLLGTSVGVVLSVVNTVLPETEKVMGLIMLPLYFLSGVMIPLQFLPHALHPYLLLNPVVHGIESLRMQFFPHYHTINGIDLMYMAYWALGALFLGLALHVRYRIRLIAK